MAQHYAWDDYFIPETHTLKNLLGVVDPGDLRVNEEDLVASRMLELQASPIPGKFDLAHMQAVHRHLFQDVYEWAGETRTAPSANQSPMNKDGVAYASIDRITKIWSAEQSRIKKQGLLRGLGSPDEFSEGLARFWGEVNHAHAFREGNTRTQAVFFEQFCEKIGYSLDIARLAPQHPKSIREAFIDARYYFQLRGDALPLAETLSKALSPLDDPQNSASTSATRDSSELGQRFPELRDMQLDPHGLSDETPAKVDETQLG